MKVSVWINRAGDLTARQTTTMLIEQGIERGHEVYVSGIDTFRREADGTIRATARRVGEVVSREMLLQRMKREENDEPVVLSEMDLVLVRTNPGRDERLWAHEMALDFARLLEEDGLTVVNRPDGLMRWSTKTALACLPAEVIPATVISHDPKDLVAFAKSQQISVIKPVRGTRGDSVFKIGAGDDNLKQVAETVTRTGAGIAQEYLPRAVDGDVRVVLWNGKLLERDGKPAAVRRRPAADDFRSNVHAGGTPEPAEVTGEIQHLIDVIGPRLVASGIYLAGLDVIGDRVVEINVFSTGGLFDAERFGKTSFTRQIWDRLEALKS